MPARAFHFRYWHKADIRTHSINVRFSHKPSENVRF
jgi:hypothetical protein